MPQVEVIHLKDTAFPGLKFYNQLFFVGIIVKKIENTTTPDHTRYV